MIALFGYIEYIEYIQPLLTTINHCPTIAG